MVLPLLALTLVGCDGGDPTESARPTPTEPTPVIATPTDRLIRASIALRGIRPSVADLEAVHADPTQLEPIVRSYAQDPEFLETIKDMWAEILLLRNDSYLVLPALGELQGYNLQDIHSSTTEEPLKLIEYVVANDRPFTEIVTADYMLANDVVAKMYGVPYDFSSEEEWQVTWWGDERPVAGLLSSAQIWRRWESNGSNFHRGRANMVAKELLCEAFDHRDILVPGGINIADEAAVAYAVRTQTACVGCHTALDPLAGYFWGYKQLIHRNFVGQSINAGCEWDWSNGATPEFGPSYLYEYYCYPLQQYSTADEQLYRQWGLPEPSYYGTPARDLSEVGQLIADDPRFSACQARQFYGYLAQVEPEAVPIDTVIDLQTSFEASSFDARELAVDIVLRDDFARLSGDAEGQGGLFTIRPEQYARIVEALTGYRWMGVADSGSCNSKSDPTVQTYGNQCWGAVDLSESDLYGFRAMAGGVDGVTVTRPIHTATPTKLVMMGALASDAAAWAVDNDLAAAAADRKLLTLVDADTADEAAIREQLVALHLQMLGEFVDADSPSVDLSWGLWSAAHAEHGDPTTAWKVTLTGLLQDPRMMFF